MHVPQAILHITDEEGEGVLLEKLGAESFPARPALITDQCQWWRASCRADPFNTPSIRVSGGAATSTMDKVILTVADIARQQSAAQRAWSSFVFQSSFEEFLPAAATLQPLRVPL